MQITGRGTTVSPATPTDGPAAPSWAEWCAWRRTGLATGWFGAEAPLFFEVAGADTVIDLREPEPVVARSTASAVVPETPRRGFVASRAIIVAAVLIVVLNVLDIITTRLALTNGAAEGNPIAALFVEYLPIFVAVKILVPASVALRIRSMRGRTTPMLFAAMWWVVGVYSMTIVVNAIHLLR